MRIFVAWLILQLGLLVSCLIDGAIAMWILNPVFHLSVGFWGWVGVSFVLVEIVSTGAQLQKISE